MKDKSMVKISLHVIASSRLCDLCRNMRRTNNEVYVQTIGEKMDLNRKVRLETKSGSLSLMFFVIRLCFSSSSFTEMPETQPFLALSNSLSTLASFCFSCLRR